MRTPKDLILLSDLADQHHIKPQEVISKAALGIVKIYLYTFGNEGKEAWFEVPARTLKFHIASTSITKLNLDTDMQIPQLIDAKGNYFSYEYEPHVGISYFRSPVRLLSISKKSIKLLASEPLEKKKAKELVAPSSPKQPDNTERGKAEIQRKYEILCAALDLINDALNNAKVMEFITRKDKFHKGMIVLNASTLASEISRDLGRWGELQARKEKHINSGLEENTVKRVLQEALSFGKKSKS